MSEIFYGSEVYLSPSPGPVVTVGNFDGVHRGHRALVERVRRWAFDLGRPSLVYTFDPLPAEVLGPGPNSERRFRIQTTAQRLEALASLEVDHIVLEPFDLPFAAGSPEWFVGEILERRLGAAAVVVGWDFRFGEGRRGSFQDMAAVATMPVESFGPLKSGDEVVSSSRIRSHVAAGDVARAADLLGRPHRLVGRVVIGDARARQLGFPTANLALDTELVPPPGVYVVRAALQQGKPYNAVMNIGVRPTFKAGYSVEVHLLDAPEGLDIYGETLHVDVVNRIRDESGFSGVEALVAQIRQDIAVARGMLNLLSGPG